MSDREPFPGGDARHRTPSPQPKVGPARHICRVLEALEKNPPRGTYEVEVLRFATLGDLLLRRKLLVEFPYDTAQFGQHNDRRRYIGFGSGPEPRIIGEVQLGWIVPGVMPPAPTSVSHDRASMLLLADGRYASSQTYLSTWARSTLGLMIPEERLSPVETMRPGVDTRAVYQSLKSYLPPSPE